MGLIRKDRVLSSLLIQSLSFLVPPRVCFCLPKIPRLPEIALRVIRFPFRAVRGWGKADSVEMTRSVSQRTETERCSWTRSLQKKSHNTCNCCAISFLSFFTLRYLEARIKRAQVPRESGAKVVELIHLVPPGLVARCLIEEASGIRHRHKA